ncbi:hypothetical protein HY948_04655 [Candidatus Gottesmanbacteria bacterium]|nr:hypothetical protein [Candidatus Gottesmanbacteria bacterium]
MLYLVSLLWITANIYFLPFHVWTAGVIYPWFMTKGLTLYKDIIWLRMPFDMFLLSAWYRLFGASGSAYQLFIWVMFGLLVSIFLWVLKRIDRKIVYPACIFFLVFLFPLFLNVEVGELMVGLLVLLLFFLIHQYALTNRPVWALAAGICAGFTVATKQNTIFVVLILPFFQFYLYIRKQSMSRLMRSSFVYVFGLTVPFILIGVYFFFRGALYDFLYYSLYTVVGPYRNFTLLDHGDGLYIEFAYGILLLPCVFLWKQLGMQRKTAILLTLFVVALIPSLLPSYLSYRTFTSFALVSVAAGYLIRGLLHKKNTAWVRLSIVCGFIGYMTLVSRYMSAYNGFVRDNGFHREQYLTDWGDFEKRMAVWINENTHKQDRIISYGSEMIYLLSDRLPANKYTNFTPFILEPFVETTKVFTSNPPAAIVFDWAHPDLPRGLSTWPFLAYMRENYREVMRMDALVLYSKNK